VSIFREELNKIKSIVKYAKAYLTITKFSWCDLPKQTSLACPALFDILIVKSKLLNVLKNI